VIGQFRAETNNDHNLAVWVRQKSKAENYQKAGKLLKAVAVN
jgi:hypothetical protein